jgi:hypothetical protein
MICFFLEMNIKLVKMLPLIGMVEECRKYCLNYATFFSFQC